MASSVLRCLQYLDILKIICIQAYEGGYDSECRAAVAALNATCRAFHRAASLVLWSRLFSLRPLVKCMPSDVWVEEAVDATDSRSAITITRPPDPPDWERFAANAALVTSFKRFGLAPDLDDDAYCTLSLYRPGNTPLLPNIQELVWEESDADAFEYGYQLLGPKLTTLHIGQPPSDTLLLPILRSLDVKCRNLRHLSVQCRSAMGPVDTVVSRSITQLHHLETIDLSLPLFDDALLHLATLPNLSVAKIVLPRTTGLHIRLPALTAAIFPALSVLHVSVIRLEMSLVTLINHISSVQLSEVRLCAAHDPTNATLRDLLSALSHTPSRSVLSALHLSFPLPSSVPLMRSLNAVPPFDHPECALDISAFTPLFRCPELTELDVASFFLRPDDALVRTLAAGCPRLQSLRLAPPYPAGRLSEVTLDGLLPLLQHCPELSELTLPLNASLAVPANGASARNMHMHMHDSQLRTLDVGDSPLLASDVEGVAAFLSAHCTHPDFEIAAAGPHDGASKPEHVRAREVHSALWAQASRLVRLFAQVRGQERDHWTAQNAGGIHPAPAFKVDPERFPEPVLATE